MKILAIRGENLASLAGAFEVDLAHPPLSDAGLLLIGGPTGAGKSTILDAVCLALFDRTPRLGGRGNTVQFLHEHDRDVLSSGDPRCLLRRGAVEAYAEVDFLGQDGARWRARWSVRRARRRPEGRIQPQQLSLESLDTSEVRGGTKTQTLSAIEEVLGLDYTAFCRAVLLAQGEFASFLRARPDERAELLERITGTSLYGVLSVAAHQRAAEERQRLELIEARLGSLESLDPTARASLEARRARERSALTSARAGRRAAEEAIRWHERMAELVAKLALAMEEQTALEEALAGAAERSAEADATAQALALGGVVGALDRAQADLEQAQAREALLGVAAEAATAKSLSAEAEHRAAEERATLVEERARALRPELDAARALDVELTRSQDALELALARRADVDEASATARARVSALGEELHIIAERRDAASAWLDAHSADAPLASQWPRWEALLSRAASLVSNRLTLLEQRPALRDALTAAEDLAQTAEESAHRAEDSLRSAERLNADLEAEAARALGGRPPRLDKEALDERRVTLAQLRAVLRRACDAQTANARARLEEASAREEIEAAAVEVAAGKSAAERTGAALAEAERALEGARVALGLEERRHDLHDGDPCPLCGAREHPYADELPPFSRLVRDLDDRVHGLRAELTSQRESAQGARVRGDLARTKALTARQRALTAEEEQRGAEELWLDLGFKLGWQAGQELPAPWDAAAVAVLDRIEGETNEQLARVRELLARQSEAAARVANRGQVNGEAQERSSTAQRELTAARHRLDLLEQRLFDQVDVERRLRAELDEAFTASDWWEELSADPQGFTLRCRSAQERYCVHQRTRAETDAAHQALSAESESAQARAVEFEAARGVAHEELTAQQRILERHRAARARCLEGRAVDQVQAELEREQLTSRDGLQAAARLATAAREESSAASARREVALSQLERCQLAAREAEAALLEALANCEQPISAVRERLARGESWLQGERRALERLALRRAELDKTVDVYASQRDEHQARGRPAQDHAAAESSLAEASEAEALAEQALLAVEARLTSDDRVVKTARSLTRRRDEQREQSALWEVMGDLIGSHDGKKFRVFAQSLTLELLLQWANRTLAELAPRYQLQRVAGQDLDLQVADLDMAGEVRPISSLSGGESFLISLALALGLSSLSAHDARVDSLFVDEGFGTLDPESQEVALATLDALQASGRQVVLISHVPGLGERIGAGIRVVPQGQGCSKVRLASA